ncbi:nucleoside hydrolase [Nonomuraea sp. NEAU-A123]|uniref:nucleoside hydrolase n=1 Tax=Nonomuraea sp. NEAU-A123 TaxID=2839649 RepID=UPI001BE3F95F|nr:nucleoside hydrolase [Nonomuraea sp. NEAU-A123]MBT2233266.1 nucleoside hydrolase [Nonomuraea sp. NEAU-A123]
METRDPDDALTLCLLATHPRVRLAAVTVNPGTGAQLAVVRELLNRLGVGVPVGARHADSPADAVSAFHHNWLGPLPAARPDGVAHEILAAAFTAAPHAVLLTGAPLHNLRQFLLHHPGLAIPRWVAQGGFAGDNLVPPEHRLSKFAGRTQCETFNFGGDKKATLTALASERIAHRDLVSKNVTHGVVWDNALQARLLATPDLPPGAVLAREAMALYLSHRPEGKLLHDPLAACAVLDRDAFTWAQVEVTYGRGQWGAQPAPDSGTFISLAVDWPRAANVLFGVGL